jgi:hypothetical protein
MTQKSVATFFGNNTDFSLVIVTLIAIAGMVFNQPGFAMLFGFAVAAFSTISNDSIQTIGTFLSSNRRVPWHILWLFIGGIMAATVVYGWITHDGDLSFGRLAQIPEPESFSFLQLLAPVVLIVLTRFRMPVSTTFLILATFSSPGTIQGMLSKTFLGYIIAFLSAIVVWGGIGLFVHKRRVPFDDKLSSESEKRWRVLQWVSTGLLWSAWLMQDFANATVFLPRDISALGLVGILLFMLSVMGFILYRRGGEMQEVINEKTDVVRVKAATIIDFTYAIILFYFKELNDLPMSTTWVFLGMLAGREIALKLTTHQDKPYTHTLKLIRVDILRAGFGLGVSLALAFFANNQL